MTTTIASELDRLARLVGGSAWGADRGKPRIYMPQRRRDAKAFVAFDDATESELGGGRLVVEIAPCGQTEAWYASQRASIAERYRGVSLAILAATRGHDDLAASILELYEIDSADMDAIASAIVNGRTAEATEIVERLIAAEA